MKQNKNLTVLTVCLIALILCLLNSGCETESPTAITSLPTWEKTNGPYGGYAYSIAINSEGHIFVGGFGIYRSMDNGTSWKYTELNGISVADLVINKVSGHIFATTRDETMRSANNGESWMSFKVADVPDKVTCFVFNSKGHIFAARYEIIFRSTDNGNNWTYVYVQNMVRTLAIGPKGHIFAGTNQGIYRSIDNGDSWTYVGLSSDITALTINSQGHIFAGTFAEGIYRSIDNGITWTRYELDSPVRSLAINSSGFLFAKTNDALFRSVDNGDSWNKIDFQAAIIDFAINPDDQLLIAGKGVFCSTDNGDHWTELNINLFNTVDYLAANSVGYIFAVASDDLYRSLDRGNHWEKISSISSPIFTITIDSQNNIFAATANGVFRSGDHGNNWIPANNGLETYSNYVSSFAINSVDHLFVAKAYGGIYRSTDKGDNWTRVFPAEFVSSITTASNEYIINKHLVKLDQILAVTGGAIIRSLDNGSSWSTTRINDMLWVGYIVSNLEGHIFVTTNNGIYRSTDNGGSWTQVHPVPYARSIAINSRGHIFVSSYTGVIRSMNNGKGWLEINDGLGSYQVNCFAFDPDGQAFAGTRGGGVFRIADN